MLFWHPVHLQMSLHWSFMIRHLHLLFSYFVVQEQLRNSTGSTVQGFLSYNYHYSAIINFPTVILREAATGGVHWEFLNFEFHFEFKAAKVDEILMYWWRTPWCIHFSGSTASIIAIDDKSSTFLKCRWKSILKEKKKENENL